MKMDADFETTFKIEWLIAQSRPFPTPRVGTIAFVENVPVFPFVLARLCIMEGKPIGEGKKKRGGGGIDLLTREKW